MMEQLKAVFKLLHKVYNNIDDWAGRDGYIVNPELIKELAEAASKLKIERTAQL